MIIGVEDNGEIIGLGNIDVFELQDQIASIVHDLCTPNILPEFYIENIDGKELLIIEVFRGGLCPYYLKPKGKSTGTYIW